MMKPIEPVFSYNKPWEPTIDAEKLKKLRTTNYKYCENRN